MKNKKTIIKASKHKYSTSFSRVYAADEQSYKDKQLERRSNAKIRKIEDIENNRGDTSSKVSALFDLLVPSSGKSKYYGGELIRAISKILYRDFNDGDVFYEGYGIETCGSAVAYLCDKLPELESMFEDIAMRNLTESAYTKELNKIADAIVDEIFDDPEEAVTRNSEDYLSYDGEKFIKDHEWEPKYELYFDYPDNIQYHLDKGDISLRDLQWDIAEWDYVRNGDVQCDRYGVSIYELSKDDYDELEYSMDRWLQDYGNDLDNEYGSEEDEEYDDEDEEE